MRTQPGVIAFNNKNRCGKTRPNNPEASAPGTAKRGLETFLRATLLTALGACTIVTAPSHARDGNADGVHYQFDISVQTLPQALRNYAQVSGQEIIFTEDLFEGMKPVSLKGNYTAADALDKLLKDTGLIYERAPSGAITILRADEGSANKQSTATFGEQEGAQTGRAEDSVQEIFVTAQRREQSLQDVPISMTVATGEMLRRENINTLEDLAERTAGVKIAKGGASDQLHIRGTGSTFNAGFEQSVATFVDGIYHSRSRSIRVAFFDVERVEVLKGPQTTFFGANAIAGAINITTKTPGEIFEGNASALYSPTDGEYSLETAIATPMTEDLAIRVAGRLSGMDGYIDADRLNTDGPDLDDKQGRISLRWTPSDRLTINARYDIARLRDKGSLMPELVGCSPTSQPQGQCTRNLNLLGQIDDRLDYHSDTAVPDKSNVDFDEAAATLKLDFDAATLIATSGYLKQNAYLVFDLAPFPAVGPTGLLTYFPTSPSDLFKQLSQEIRLQSNTDGPLSYMVGGYYEHGKLANNANLGFYFAPLGGLAAPVYSATTPVAAEAHVNQKSDSWSAFASVSYDLTDKLTLSSGLRYSSVRKEADRRVEMGTADAFASGASFVPAPLSVQRILGPATGNSLAPFPISSRTDDKFMPSANLRYKVADGMIYVSYARGFKAGGFSATTPDTFRPELVDNYEAGIKTLWWDRRLTTNLSVFRADYSDLQETANVFLPSGALISVVTNAAESQTRGVEFSGSLRLGNLILRSDLAYIDSHYLDYPNAPCTPLETVTGAVCPRDLSGKTRAYAPKWTGSAGADYRMGLSATTSLRLGATVYFSSAYFLQPAISDLVEQEGYAKLDLRAAIGAENGQWELAVIGKNITDKTTAVFENYVPGAPSSLFAVPDRPRSVAIQASMKW